MNFTRNQNQPSISPLPPPLSNKMDKTTTTNKTTQRVSSFLSHFTFHHQSNTHNSKKSSINHHSLSINSSAKSKSQSPQQQPIISPNSDLSSIISPSPITPNNDLTSYHQIHIQDSSQNQITTTTTTTTTPTYFQFPFKHKSTLTSPISIPIPTDSTSTLTTHSSLFNLSRSTSVLTDESQSLPSSTSSRSNHNKPTFIKVLKKLNEQPPSPIREVKISQSNQISKPLGLTPLWESEFVHFPSTKAALEGFIKYRGTLLKHTPPNQAGFWNSKSSKVWKTTLCCLTAIYPHNHPTLNSESTLYNLHIFNSPSPAQAELESARLRIEASSIVCVLENNMAGESLVLKITGREVTKNLDTSQFMETQTSWMFAMEDVSHLKTWMKTFKEIVNELRQNPTHEHQPVPLSAASTTRSFSSMTHHSNQPINHHSRLPSRQTNINPSLCSMNPSIRSSVSCNFIGPTSFQSATPKPKSETWSPIKSQSFHQPLRNEVLLETLKPDESQYLTSPLFRSQTSIPIHKSNQSQSSSFTSSLLTSLPCPPRRSSKSLHPNPLKSRPLLSNLIIVKRPSTISSTQSDFDQNGKLSGPMIPPPTAALPPIPDESTEKISEETIH